MSRRERSGRRPGRAVAVTLVATSAALVLGACGRSDFQYVQNEDEGVYLRLPRGWDVVENNLAPIALEGRVMVELWEVGMTAEPVAAGGGFPQVQGTLKVSAVNPDIRNALSVDAHRDVALTLPGDDGGRISFQSLIDEDDGRVVLVADEDIIEGELRGNRAVYRVTLNGTDAIVDHLVTFDQATSRTYELYFSCETLCYEANRVDINDIVDSLTVEDH